MPRKTIRGNMLIGGSLTVGGTITPSLGTEFTDSTFALTDNGDATKKASFQVSGVTAGQNRVFTVPDYNGTLVTIAGTETLTGKTLTAPKIAIIADANGNEVIECTATGSAVNQLEVVNAPTTGAVQIKTKGGDADIGIRIIPKGWGTVSVMGPFADYTDPTTVSEASDQAITAAAVVKKIYIRDCNGSARQDTLPAAAALVGAFPGAFVGLSFVWIVKNSTGANYALTLAAPDGAVTITGTATVGQNNTKLFLVRLTNVGTGTEAYTAYSLGTLIH